MSDQSSERDFSFDDIAEEYAQPETFDVETQGKNGKRIFTFRSPKNAEAILAIEQKAVKFHKAITASPHPQLKKYLPITLTTARQLMYIAELAVSPKFTQGQLLRMAKEMGPLFILLYGNIQAKGEQFVATQEVAGWDAEGEDLSEMSSDETTSVSDAISSANIPGDGPQKNGPTLAIS